MKEATPPESRTGIPRQIWNQTLINGGVTADQMREDFYPIDRPSKPVRYLNRASRRAAKKLRRR